MITRTWHDNNIQSIYLCYQNYSSFARWYPLRVIEYYYTHFIWIFFDTQPNLLQKLLPSSFSISIMKTSSVLVYLVWISTWRTFSIRVIIFYTVCIHFHARREKATISYFKQKYPNKSSECIQIVAKEEFYNRQKIVILLCLIFPLTCLYPLLTFLTLLNHKSN